MKQKGESLEFTYIVIKCDRFKRNASDGSNIKQNEAEMTKV